MPNNITLYSSTIKTMMLLVCSLLFTSMNVLSAHPFHTSNHTKQTMLRDLPEIDMNVSQIIAYHKYPVEIHEVHTEDGYILSVIRIPHGRKVATTAKGVVFLQHGLMDSSSTWVMNGPSDSLAFVLADEGYDVWLGNSRGNTHSKKHVRYTPHDAEFWDFTFNELAVFDIPACLNYMMKVGNRTELHYIGHSQGTMVGWVEFSQNQELASKVKTMYALGPASKVHYVLLN